MTGQSRRLIYFLTLVLIVTVTGCGNSEQKESSDITPTSASSKPNDTNAQPTSLPPKPTTVGPQPTALPTQQLPHKGTDADGNGFYTSDEFQDAITALFQIYEWPSGFTPDVEAEVAQLDESDLADAEFEVLGEYTTVGRYYQCAWGQTWLDAFANSDTPIMDASLQHLRDELALNPMREPATQDYIKNMYDKASLGDPALLLQFINVNCGGLKWLDHPTTPSG